MNNITLIGRLTQDPELRTTQQGTAVTSFSIAVDRGKDQGADFIDCVAWRGTAEFVNTYFRKGQAIAVIGRLQMRQWTDKNENRRVSAEVVCDRVFFCGSKSDNSAPVKADFTALDDDDEDLPF